MIPVEFASKDFARIGNPQRVIFIKSMPADAVIEVTRCFSTFSAPTSRFLANDGVVR
jgi:hypothetical protein